MDNDTYSYGDLVSKNRYAKKLRNDSQEKSAQSQLTRHVTKKIKTTMIGALDSFEKAFGEVWGHDEEQGNLTDDQLDMRELWEEVRTEILDRGNAQMRDAEDEISQYTLKWNKFNTEFIVRN